MWENVAGIVEWQKSICRRRDALPGAPERESSHELHELHELIELIELQQRKKTLATRYVAARSSRFERLKQQQRRPIRDAGPSTKRALVERSTMMGDMQPSPACRASRKAVVGSATDELSAVTPARGDGCSAAAQGACNMPIIPTPQPAPKSTFIGQVDPIDALEYSWITRLRRSRR